MTVPNEFRSLLPQKLATPDHDPVYFLWCYDPQEDRVLLDHNENKHPAHTVDHTELAKIITHPDRVHGYAYRIRGGFRITNYEHKPVDDPHVLKEVERALRGEKHKVGKSQVQTRAL